MPMLKVVVVNPGPMDEVVTQARLEVNLGAFVGSETPSAWPFSAHLFLPGHPQRPADLHLQILGLRDVASCTGD